MEYEPSAVVKKHTLDERLQNELYFEKTYVLEDKIKTCQICIDISK